MIHKWYIRFARKTKALTLKPTILKTRCDVVHADENYEVAVQNLLHQHGLKNIRPSMSYNWINILASSMSPEKRANM